MSDHGKGWCTTCHAMRVIDDKHEESYYATRDEHAFVVTEFACGHNSQSEPRVTGPAPGGDSVSEAIAQQDLIRRQEQW